MRWVASSARSVRAVWNNYTALVSHFETASNDPNRDSKERATYKGLKTYLTDNNFVLNMGLMLDALTELEDLSLELQKRSTTLIRAHKLLELKCRVFDSMCCSPGEHLEIASKAVAEGCFLGIPLHQGKVTQIKPSQFYRSLYNNMNTRMTKTQASHCSMGGNAENENKYMELLKDLEVLDKTKWPEDMDICFGDKAIKNLCKRFNIQNAQQCVRGYREMLLSGSITELNNEHDLKPLMDAVHTLIVSTAECERSFSNMNDVLTPTRNSLLVDTVSDVIFVRNNGPPLEYFKPEGFVKSWIANGRRHADVTTSRSRQSEKRKIGSSPGLEVVWKNCIVPNSTLEEGNI